MKSSTTKISQTFTETKTKEKKVQIYFYPKSMTHVALMDGHYFMSYSLGDKRTVGEIPWSFQEDRIKYGKPVKIDLDVKDDTKNKVALTNFSNKKHNQWNLFTNNCAHAVSGYLMTNSLLDETLNQLRAKKAEASQKRNDAEYIKYHRMIHSLEKSKRLLVRKDWDAEMKKMEVNEQMKQLEEKGKIETGKQQVGKFILLPREVAKFANKLSLIQIELKRENIRKQDMAYRSKVVELLKNDIKTLKRRQAKAEIKKQTKKAKKFQERIDSLTEFKKKIKNLPTDQAITEEIVKRLPEYMKIGAYGGAGLNDFLSVIPTKERNASLDAEKQFLNDLFHDLTQNEKKLKTALGFTPAEIKHLQKLAKDAKVIDWANPDSNKDANKIHVLFHEVTYTLENRKASSWHTQKKATDTWCDKWLHQSKKLQGKISQVAEKPNQSAKNDRKFPPKLSRFSSH